MKRVLRPLLVLHPNHGVQRRVSKACGDDYQFVLVPDWGALEEAVREGPPAAMVLVDPYDSGGEGVGAGELSPRLKELLQAYPSTAMIAAMPVRPETHEDVRQLGRWGIVQVIGIGHDDTVAAIARRLDGARGRPMRALLEQVLPPETSGRARAIIDAAADVVAMGEHGRDLAETMHLSRRTLLRWSQRAGLPPPRRLLAWMRVLLACELLDDPGRSVFSVARTAGYASDSGLRRITQKFLRASPTDLRAWGAFPRASTAFVTELAEYRLKVRVTTREG
jgi:AraC-like DNA-binding protein